MSKESEHDPAFLTVTKISAQLEAIDLSIEPSQLNGILAKLGWQKSKENGWFHQENCPVLVEQIQHDSGQYYLKWSPEILENVDFLKAVMVKIEGETEEKTLTFAGSMRPRYSEETSFRTKDGHLVRSKAEKIIDNWLYNHGIVHAYEPKIPIEEVLFADFYIPEGKVYVEYWGLENDVAYENRKQKKLALYKKYDLNLLELCDADIQMLDDVLPQKLLSFGVRLV